MAKAKVIIEPKTTWYDLNVKLLTINCKSKIIKIHSI
jgi:hypothetical protein